MKPLALLLLIALTACDDDDPYMLKTLKEADLKRLNEVAHEEGMPARVRVGSVFRTSRTGFSYFWHTREGKLSFRNNK